MNDCKVFLGSLPQCNIKAYRSLDDLLRWDKQREKDGFPKKIKVGKLLRPDKRGSNKVKVVPTTTEEKLLHDTIKPPQEEDSSGGAGEGEEGEVIGEQPIDQEGPGSGGAGGGEGADHETGSDAYELGKALSEKFSLPNLQQKGKKKAVSHYKFDLTDKHQGSGQILDKKATLRKLIKTNMALGKITHPDTIDPNKLLVDPQDKIYRILSREKVYEAQALIFFIRDYSGSMSGKPTELVVNQHVLIYSWLLYQYAKRVETRFILHDTEAQEVPDFYTYYNKRVAGGTYISSAYELVLKLIEEENLERDYNIYIFQGTDGDDWDSEGQQSLPLLEKLVRVVNRFGITVVNRGGTNRQSEMEEYLENSKILRRKPNEIRLNKLREDSNEEDLIKGIEYLVSEKKEK